MIAGSNQRDRRGISPFMIKIFNKIIGILKEIEKIYLRQEEKMLENLKKLVSYYKPYKKVFQICFCNNGIIYSIANTCRCW